MPSQSITYNGYSFPYVRMTVQSTAVYADDNATQMATDHLFTITGTVGGISEADLQQNLGYMRSALATPRQSFSATYGGVQTYAFGPADDVAFGPKPGALTVWNISGGRAAAYSWTIGVRAKFCGSQDSSAPSSSILASVREYEFLVDLNGFTRRTASGRLTLTGSAAAKLSPHAYAALIDIAQPYGYQRVARNYKVSADGLHLDYSIVDQEVNWVLPIPVTSGAASFRVSVAPYGARQEWILTGWFEAPASIGKDQLLQQALLLAAQRFSVLNTLTVVPGPCMVEEDVYNHNRISFSFSAHSASSGDASSSTTKTPLATFGTPPPGSTGNQAQFVGVYGGTGGSSNSGILAPAIAIGDACNGSSTTSGSTGVSGVSPPDSPQPQGGSASSDRSASTDQMQKSAGVSAAHASAMYLEYRETVTWHLANHIRTLSPKKAGVDPFHQQTSAPVLTISQIGYCVRAVFQGDAKSLPNPAPLFYPAATVQMLDSDIQTTSGDPIGNSGWDKYKTKWTYVMRRKEAFASQFSGGSTDFGFSIDPRRTFGENLLLNPENIPDVVVVPAS